MVTDWWSAAHLIRCSFLNPGETITSEQYALQVNEMHLKLQPLQLAFVNRMGPVALHHSAWLHVAHPTLQKLNKLGCEVLLHLHIHLTCRQPTATSSGISTTVCRQNASTTIRRQKMLSKSLLNSKA